VAARVSISSSCSAPQSVIGLGNSPLAVDVAVTPERFINLRLGQTVTESNLVKLARRGDGLAFGELAEWSRERLLKVARRILGNDADAEDAVQDSLLNAFVKLRMFDGRSTFLTWVTRITINCSLMRLRTRRKSRERYRDPETDNEYEEANCPNLNPEQIVAREEEKKLLLAAVDVLPDKIKVAVKVGSLNERSAEETACSLGVSPGAVKARLFRAKDLLRRKLACAQDPRRQQTSKTRRARISLINRQASFGSRR
jgi:RNA polymerase sigma factor (sigma-70 family)